MVFLRKNPEVKKVKEITLSIVCKVELGNSYFKVIGERVDTRGALKPPNFPFVFAFIFSLDIRDVSGLGKIKQ